MDAAAVPEIDVDELERQMMVGAYVLDVREHHEHAEAHIGGVVLIPLDSLDERSHEVPSDRPVYVVCASGGRSYLAVERLRQRNVDAINVAGGTKGWVEAGKPFSGEAWE